MKGRRFKELQVAPNAEDIDRLELVDRVPRGLQAVELTDGLPFDEVETAEHLS